MFPGSRFRRFICVNALLFCCAPFFYGQAKATSVAAPLAANVLGKGTIPLNGPWQFHLGDDMAWSNPNFDDSHWEQLTADRPWGEQGHLSYTGFAWYRRRIEVTLAPGASPDLALLLPQVDDAYELYWNGLLVGHIGKMPPDPVWYSNQPVQTFGLGSVQRGVLAVRVWKVPPLSSNSGTRGGFEALPLLGTVEAIAACKDKDDYEWLRSQQVFFATFLLSGLAALLGLVGWLRDRSQWLLFWMAGFGLGFILSTMFLAFRIPWPSNFALGLVQPSFGISIVSLWFLLLWLLELRDNPRLVRLIRIAALIEISTISLDGLLILTNWTSPAFVHPAQIADAVLTAIYTPLGIVPLVLVIYAVVRRRPLGFASWLVAVFAFLAIMIPVVTFASAQGRRFTHWTLADKINAPLFTLNGNSFNVQSITGILLLVAVVNAVLRASIETIRRRTTLEQEFKSARELQASLIPATLPPLPGFALTSAYRPAFEVGGDFFQIIPLGGDSTLVILGDVSGKGLKAALTVSLIVGSARTLAESTSNPAEILAGLNRSLHGHLQGGFATCIVLRVQRDGSCAASSAGHPAPFLNDREASIQGALPLGLFPVVTYEQTLFSLETGDHLALYTDGLLEARRASGELYSFDRLKALFATRPTAEEATQAAVAFGQDDDITVLVLSRLGIEEQLGR